MIGRRPMVPESFEVPEFVETESFILRPLTWDGFPLDYEAYMSSVEHLQRTFDLDDEPLTLSGERWPANSDMEFAVLDAAWCHMEWKIFRSSFTYCARNKAETRQLGCGYIFPSLKQGFDVECQTWVRVDEFERGMDPEFYEWFRAWVEDVWPFEGQTVGWPGREISWAEWNATPEKGSDA